jgi:hypothetical protein
VGLLREGINEVIATTWYNAAPMGIINRRGRLQMVLFHGSHTAENVKKDGWIVANFVFDPVLYVKTAFGDLEPEAFVEVDVEGMPMHRLKDAEAWAAYLVDIEKETQEALVVSLSPRKEEVLNLRLNPVNRGFSSVVEATVHATRYVMNKDPGLLELIEHHAGLIRKCGGEREWEALKLLRGYISGIKNE